MLVNVSTKRLDWTKRRSVDPKGPCLPQTFLRIFVTMSSIAYCPGPGAGLIRLLLFILSTLEQNGTAFPLFFVAVYAITNKSTRDFLLSYCPGPKVEKHGLVNLREPMPKGCERQTLGFDAKKVFKL